MVVRFLAHGFRWHAHLFSISCRPDGIQIRLTIKQRGDFTGSIVKLKPDTPVLIDGPHGIFTSRRGFCPKVILIAGGIGITPFRSLAEEFLSVGKEVVLIYGNLNSAGIALQEELNELAARLVSRFRVIYIMSDESAWLGEKGLINKEKILRLVPDVHQYDVYLFGPPSMMKGLRVALSQMGVPKKQIHYERFAL
ncbi:MAG: hypothetical protein JW774_11910 [Candidatus Aureabacteria bacterium]|nr:hypothetical protein [Candidatus Auribacterota bacterium]